MFNMSNACSTWGLSNRRGVDQTLLRPERYGMPESRRVRRRLVAGLALLITASVMPFTLRKTRRIRGERTFDRLHRNTAEKKGGLRLYTNRYCQKRLARSIFTYGAGDLQGTFIRECSSWRNMANRRLYPDIFAGLRFFLWPCHSPMYQWLGAAQDYYCHFPTGIFWAVFSTTQGHTVRLSYW
jgi:hypothetical protein